MTSEEFYASLGINIISEHSAYVYEAEMPEWSTTEKRYWTDYFDERGRFRFTSFVKITPYDTEVFARPIPRYIVTYDYNNEDSMDSKIHMIVLDHATNEAIYITDSFYVRSWEQSKYAEAARAVRKEVQDWIDEHYPDYENWQAYW